MFPFQVLLFTAVACLNNVDLLGSVLQRLFFFPLDACKWGMEKPSSCEPESLLYLPVDPALCSSWLAAHD